MELLLGALAGALAQIFTIPVSVIAVRQQIASNSRPMIERTYADIVSEVPESEVDNSFVSVGRKIINEDGISGLWLGLKPSLVLTVNPAITYGVYERVKSVILNGTGVQKMTPWIAFFVGAFSKTLATIVRVFQITML